MCEIILLCSLWQKGVKKCAQLKLTKHKINKQTSIQCTFSGWGGHYLSARETSFEWRLAGRPVVARFCMLTGDLCQTTYQNVPCIKFPVDVITDNKLTSKSFLRVLSLFIDTRKIFHKRSLWIWLGNDSNTRVRVVCMVKYK